ncbi:MAG: EAL domain-containing protein [Pseudomonadota bacterium]|nr:EAL domain-containing protein [Pseudomonadota bacterium]
MRDVAPDHDAAWPNSRRSGLLSRFVEAPFRTTVAQPNIQHTKSPDEHSPRLRTWHLLCLVEIGNFVALRRHLGIARTDRLVLDVVERIAAAIPDARLRVVARAQIEVVAEGDAIENLTALAALISTAADQPFDLEGEDRRVEFVIGGAASPHGLIEDVRVTEEAEHALDQARGDHQAVLRDLSIGAAAFDRRTLGRELSSALANGQMFLQYQPKVHVRRQEIASAEALIRWNHPERGLILPGDFITVAEEAHEIRSLTLWTIDQVITDQKLLAADGNPLAIFINISGQLLGDKQFVDQACAKIRNSDARIGFEITETAVIRDPESAIANLNIFAEQGITIAIDDYGAGLSSLAYLKQLPARELKIDKMFVMQLTSSNRDPLIVRSTIDLAHALDMEVTAEGVETQAAMALLSVMGCDMVQGYLVSRPLSIGAFRHFLAEDKARMLDEPANAAFARPASFWKSA